ncbi:MAG: hypothetical protein PHD37_05665 [Gallionellaceae bacterium]|nr:hypothetical protein [Gallionellaceae bacterium]
MQTKLLLPLLSTLLASLAVASDAKPEATCHRLMTDRECSEHKSLLVALPSGAALDQYLAEYTRTRQEREAACTYIHDLSSDGARPPQQQALLRY